MLMNFHTHTTYCDGGNSPEEMVREAIERGFSVLGFSGHCETPFDDTYCMRDPAGYREEITRLKEVYRGKIRILLGIEEDLCQEVTRGEYEYLIGSSHYLQIGETYYPLDSGYDRLKACVDTAFGGDPAALAEQYYSTFCDYILRRKPDIVGHFDLITKYDENDPPLFTGNPEVDAIAVRYAETAARSGCLFEVNTGAMARGLRVTPYPSEQVLYALKRQGARLVLSSDSHSCDTLDFQFEETKAYLREIGFTEYYGLGEHCPIREVL